jgi:hypothetical protein
VASAFSQDPSRATLARPFDEPAATKIVDLGPSPYYPNAKTAPRVKLSCYFFPTFMVKEYDEGQKGAEWLAIVPISSKELPACGVSRGTADKLLGKAVGGDDWEGYFWGAKENFVFFTSADDADGGVLFAVYDSSTGEKVFEDTAYDSSSWDKKDQNSPFNRLRISSVQDGPLFLKYLRVVEAGCDLRTKAVDCWDRVRLKLNLKTTKMPVCTGYQGYSGDSIVAYPVSVFLAREPVVTTVDGPVKCWPQL